MSYDIQLDCELDQPHTCAGGTYVMGGTTEPWLNVTYNYSRHFARVFRETGIRGLYGQTAEQSIPWLTRGIEQLDTDTAPDYWAATEGNARAALMDLRTIAEQAVSEGKGNATWSGD